MPPEMLAALVAQAIAAGVARCAGCTLPVVDPDDVMATICPDCGEVEILHVECAAHLLGAEEVTRAKRRASWRWN